MCKGTSFTQQLPDNLLTTPTTYDVQTGTSGHYTISLPSILLKSLSQPSSFEIIFTIYIVLTVSCVTFTLNLSKSYK